MRCHFFVGNDKQLEGEYASNINMDSSIPDFQSVYSKWEKRNPHKYHRVTSQFVLAGFHICKNAYKLALRVSVMQACVSCVAIAKN